MHKILLWAAAVTFSFATFLASCATQPQSDEQKAPAPATHKQGAGHSKTLAGIALRSVHYANPSSASTAPIA